MESASLQKTPLHAAHVSLGAKMMPFGGFDMPVQYSGIIDEHMAVREAAGLFDVSHMGEVLVTGPEAFSFVQHLVTNDAARLVDGQAMYTVMCRPDGGIVDDLLVYRLAEQQYLLVINAANIDKDWAWMQANNPMEATLENQSDAYGLLAIQGPRAFEIVQSITEVPVGDLKFYHFLQPDDGSFLGLSDVILSYTGYTGEPGMEIYCRAEDTEQIWQALLEAGTPQGLKPAGLGARDTLRLEAGFCLYGNDLTDNTSPLEGGLGWLTKLDKGDFIGREALLAQKAEGLTRKLVGFVMTERGIPRAGYSLVDESGTEIGIVTSGTQSPILGQGIGLGYVPNAPAFTTPGETLYVQARNRQLKAVVTRPPFHKKK